MLGWNICYSQTNLIKNGSFELNSDCPMYSSQIEYCNDWFDPTLGTSDYYKNCGIPSSFSTPSNQNGYCYAHSGEAYIGLYNVLKGYKEYSSSELKQTLKANKTYYFEMYVHASTSYNIIINSFGAYFSDTVKVDRSIYTALKDTPQVKANKYLHRSWTKISGTFVAKGGEKYITIGNFYNPDTTQQYVFEDTLTEPYLLHPTAYYYYFDDLFLNECEEAVKFNLGNDTLLCQDNSILLNPNISGDDYTWNNGSKSPTQLVYQTGLYILTIVKGGCSFTDSIRVDFATKTEIDLGRDTSLCFQNDSLILDISSQFVDSYLWQDSSVSSLYTIKSPGKYWVIIKNSVCISSDTIVINQSPIPIFSLGNDTILCLNNRIILGLNTPNGNYIWSDGTKNKTVIPTNKGVYWCKITNNWGCKYIDTINVNYYSKPNINKFESEIIICPIDTILSPGKFKSYLWQDGSTDSVFKVNSKGKYNVIVTDVHGCINETNTEIIDKCEFEVWIPNAFNPNSLIEANKVFKIVVGEYSKLDINVFNKWGQLIFHSNNNNGWDGNGFSTDVYIYMVEVRSMSNKLYSYSGSLTLIK